MKEKLEKLVQKLGLALGLVASPLVLDGCVNANNTTPIIREESQHIPIQNIRQSENSLIIQDSNGIEYLISRKGEKVNVPYDSNSIQGAEHLVVESCSKEKVSGKNLSVYSVCNRGKELKGELKESVIVYNGKLLNQYAGLEGATYISSRVYKEHGQEQIEITFKKDGKLVTISGEPDNFYKTCKINRPK